MTTQIEKIPSENELSAQFKVTISGSSIHSKVQNWLVERSKTVSLDGFRKGKVPFKKVEELYKDQAIEQLLKSSIEDSYKTIEKENTLRPVFQPSYQLTQAYNHETQSDFIFQLEVLNFPEVVLKDFKEISLERILVVFDDKEIDESAERIAKEKTFLVDVSNQHCVKETDVATVTLKTSLGSKILKDYCAKSIKLPIVLERQKTPDESIKESVAFVDSVMNACLGKIKGDECQTTHSFPEDFKDKSLANQTVTIGIKIHSIQENKHFPVGEELAKHSGFDSLQGFKDDLRDKIQKEYDGLARIYHKRRLLDALSTSYPLSVPSILVDREFNNIWNRLKEETKDEEWDKDIDEENLKKEYYAIADRRVRLGLVIGQFAKEHKINVSADMIRRAIWEEVSRSPWNEKQIISYYESNPSAVAFLKSSLLEDIVVNEILEKVTHIDIILTPEELRERMKDVLPDFSEEELEKPHKKIEESKEGDVQ